MAQELSGKRYAALVTDGFEQVELSEPKRVLETEGATVHIIAPNQQEVRSWDRDLWGPFVKVDVVLSQANPDDYDGLLLPGGVMSPDKLRMNNEAVAFVHSFFQAGKPVAAICHGPWTLIEAGVVKGRTLTSYPSLRTDLKNAGATWINKEVVVADGLVTSRSPDDLRAFNQKMIETFQHHKQLVRR